MGLLIHLIFLLFATYANAQHCEQCDTSKAAFFATNTGLASGACGYGSLALKMYAGHVAAARQNIYRAGGGCGACYQIRCENSAVCSKAGTNIVVTDFHNTTTNFTDFVLSNRAFRAMALPGKDKHLLGLGIVNVEYKRVPCVYKGQNLAIKVEEFSKPPNYIAIKILYQGGQTKIAGAEVARVDIPVSWISMSHNYGAVWDTSNAPKGSLQFRFIIYSGYDAQYFYTNQVLPAKWTPGAIYNSTVQISNIAIENCKACKGFKVPNNYETDLIYPIIEKTSELANLSYSVADDSTKTKLKIIGDHMRAVVYLISDGVVPSNIGRGYIVRRLIRRAVRTGRLLGIKGDGKGNLEGAFLPAIAQTVIDLSTEIDQDVKSREIRIIEELRREELRFVQTLERGEKLLEQMLEDALSKGRENGHVPCLSGKDAFLLYDTFGFPVEITVEVGEERGIEVDMEGFNVEMENQRQQSQAAHNAVKLSVGNSSDLTETISNTEFLGYDSLSTRAVVEGLLVNGSSVIQVSEGNEVEVLLDRTPFYAESGGQIGDNGFLYVNGVENRTIGVVKVKDVQKISGSIFVHKGILTEGALEVGQQVEAAVDPKLRQRAEVHHTATHLLQAALKKVVGEETSQAGSLVAFDRLRFDFNFHRSLSDGEILEIESLINEWIGDATLLQTNVMALTDAKKAGAIAMFGEKYGDEVRVVEVPGVSMELCGGTHVTNTSEIRGFRIISEQAVASGVRRIEAVAGDAFVEYVTARDNYMKNLCSTLKVKAEEVPSRVDALLEELRQARNEVSAARAKAAVYKASTMVDKAFLVGTSKKIRVIVESMEDIDADSLKNAAEFLVNNLEDPAAVILGSSPGEGKVSLVAAFTPGVVGLGVQAGKFIGPIAKLCGGGGGGRPNFAQAGGKKPENLLGALDKARDDIVSVLTDKAS